MNDMAAFECDFQTFKNRTKEFLDILPNCTRPEVENAWKALSLSYLHLKASDLDLHQAAIVLNIAVKQMCAFGHDI